jgi:dihydrofolate synthase/folylpolyglutamate synthase
MKRTLDQWLDYQLGTHPKEIAMGLDRLREVARRMDLLHLPCPLINVAGTNGKGSTIALIESIARASGLRVGVYSSPHFLRYNERVRVNGVDISDVALIEAFEAIELARSEIPLTYFEFGTLAGIYIFAKSHLDLVVLEVGLGGRLDAVNFLDADVAVITTVDLDHQAYLGNDRESIGIEKAGIMRSGKPCILGEKDPPSSVLRHAYEHGVYCVRGYSDYLIDRFDDHWVWREPGFSLELPFPTLKAPIQIQNAACAIAALRAAPVDIIESAWAEGVVNARLTGRLQTWQTEPEVVLDVAHNPQSVTQLLLWLAQNPKPTVAVFSALNDKDIISMIRELSPSIQRWYVGALSEPVRRCVELSQWPQILAEALPEGGYRVFENIPKAYSQALADNQGERVLVFGSFHTLEAVMRIPQQDAVRV